jgi:hypothetical protein
VFGRLLSSRDGLYILGGDRGLSPGVWIRRAPEGKVRYTGCGVFLLIENIEILSNECLDCGFSAIQFIENIGISLHLIDIL